MSYSTAFPLADMVSWWWIPVAAIVLDALVGDPHDWPHPVRALGALCSVVEPTARRAVFFPRMAGVVAVVCVLGITWLSVRLVLLAPEPLAVLLAVYLAFAGLAQGQLLREGRAAVALLEAGNLEAARNAVAMLVSRDVSTADNELLCRSLAETLGENFNDAFIAPLFWLVLGGPVGLWLYKAASTMDSMWGYPQEPWTRFGTAAARLDDVLAYVPARLSAVFLFLAGYVQERWFSTESKKEPQGASLWPGFARVAQDARTMKSPNAGWPMAAAAWLHGASMGGPTRYAGTMVHKPLLGPHGRPWTLETLKALCRTLQLAGILGGALLCGLGFLIHALYH